MQVSSVFSPGNFQGFALVNRQRTKRISTGFTVEVSTEGTQLSYSNFDYLGQEPHYWQLPGVYQGDKVSATESLTAEQHQKPVDRSHSATISMLLPFSKQTASLRSNSSPPLTHFDSSFFKLFLDFNVLSHTVALFMFAFHSVERFFLYPNETSRAGTGMFQITIDVAFAVY